MIRLASVLLALSLPTSAATAYAEWETETATACSQNAWTLTGLGVVGIAVILRLGGATISHNELYYRNSWWRLSWWASCLSLLAGIMTLGCVTVCGSHCWRRQR